MIKILLKFEREEEYEDGNEKKIDEHFTLFDAPASWGGVKPNEIYEGYILAKCIHCNKLQLIGFDNFIAESSYKRQMGYEVQYMETIHATCDKCGINESYVEFELWEYPEYVTYIEGISFNEFEVDLKCTDYMILLLDNIDLLNESSKKSFKTELLEAQTIKSKSDELENEIEKLKLLIANQKSKENDFQQFFERNHWMFGIDYIDATPTKKISDEHIPDFLLERYDGFHDILDLKLPIPNLFKKIGNKLHPRHELNDGCSQVEHYLAYSNENLAKLKEELQEKIYRPKGFLVIGLTNAHEEERLRQYIDDHPKVKIMTYDDIIKKATNLLNTINSCDIDSIKIE